MATAPWIVSDALGERIEPLLPTVERRVRFRGRRERFAHARAHEGDPARGIPLPPRSMR